ncbi:hypothetical protein [Microlunatus sp. Gsoil 973]|jgi:hypothetical protein|uniref:hypothetical protein n=1 Tax=Microlunatus sp. Gsoil 973 TaxID=2672569 RepID=UPI0012B4CC4B|nr:hypothetical protein [Microlunatus sp. Gsoil 973]QGN33310.1 hypothetical protein GJV80_11390 [Microlunatus sp. Gsoil 973]
MINQTSRLRRAGIAGGAMATVALVAGLLTPTTADAAAKNACSGVTSHCKIVAHVDVTGDGRPDSVGIVRQRTDGDVVTRYQVRIRTAGGKLLHKTDKSAAWIGPLYRGAAKIDGRRGKELVVGHVLGAHTAFYRVYRYHNGKLVLLKSPKLPKKVSATTLDRSWAVDSAVASFEGIRRTRHNGHVVLTNTFGSRDPSARVYSGWKLKYRWEAGHWKSTSVVKRTFTNKQAAKAWGWHVKGMRTGF